MARASDRPGVNKQRGSTNPKTTVSGTAPSSPAVSDIWFDTATPAIKYWDGSSWTTIGAP